MVPGAWAGATPNGTLDPSAMAVSDPPVKVPPRIDTVMGTSFESRLSVFHNVSGIVHDVADV
jgi:hypothetical protein